MGKPKCTSNQSVKVCLQLLAESFRDQNLVVVMIFRVMYDDDDHVHHLSSMRQGVAELP